MLVSELARTASDAARAPLDFSRVLAVVTAGRECERDCVNCVCSVRLNIPNTPLQTSATRALYRVSPHTHTVQCISESVFILYEKPQFAYIMCAVYSAKLNVF